MSFRGVTLKTSDLKNLLDKTIAHPNLDQDIDLTINFLYNMVLDTVNLKINLVM